MQPCTPFRLLFPCALVAAAAFIGLPSIAAAQTGYSITGGMSNFDCGNHCDDPCDEFEVEIEDIRPEDVVHCYHNGNYGSPIVVLSSSGTFTIIDYRNPQHLTAVGAIEHFGITLRQLGPTNTIRVRWMRNGQPATVHGRVPVQGGGTAPATQPVMPTVSTELGTGIAGESNISLSVTNNDLTQSIWVKRRAQILAGPVTLEALMPNDPIVTTTVELDPAAFLLAPGQTVTTQSDLVEVEDNQSVIFVAEYAQDLASVGPFNQTHIPGPTLGNVMTASIASPMGSCDYYAPAIITQPPNVTAAAGREVQIQVNADANDGGTLSYQWMKEGQILTNSGHFRGVTSDELDIDSLSAETEGFYSVTVSNNCGSTTSQSAIVSITGHNLLRAPLAATIDPPLLEANVGDTVTLTGSAAFAPAGTTYQWKHNGINLLEGDAGASPLGGFVTGASGIVDTVPVTLTIDNFQETDAGDYTIVFTNSAGNATSAATKITMAVPPPPFCPADFNGDGSVNPDDLGDFITCYFTEPPCPAADFNADSDVNPDDLGDFITTYFGSSC